MTSKNAFIIVGNVVLAAVSLTFFIQGKMPGEQFALVLTCIGFPSAAEVVRKSSDDPPDAPALAVAFLGIVLASASACAALDKTRVRDGITLVNAGCHLVQALTDDGAIKSVCATASELSTVAKLLLAERGDAGSTRARSGGCVVLPTTSYCATGAETARGIDAIVAQRVGWFSLDAGATP